MATFPIFQENCPLAPCAEVIGVMTDVELLEKHRAGDDEAFAELVKRHIGWVYGVARRRLRDAHLAEDTAQATFVLLHRKAPRFPSDSAMIAWLHKSAWYATETAAKIERRRLRRETEAAMRQPTTTDGAADTEWQKLAPMLDALIGKLGHGDREAVLLRYYRGLSFVEVGKEIGATEEAARKRVERAIDKLRQMAAKAGMPLSAAALAGHLGVHAVVAPPVGLTAVVTGAAAAPAGSALAASSGVIVKGAIIMGSTKAVVAAGAGIAVLVLAGGTAWKVASTMPENPVSVVATAPAALGPPPVFVGFSKNDGSGPAAFLVLPSSDGSGNSVVSGELVTVHVGDSDHWDGQTVIGVTFNKLSLSNGREIPLGYNLRNERVGSPTDTRAQPNNAGGAIARLDGIVLRVEGNSIVIYPTTNPSNTTLPPNFPGIAFPVNENASILVDSEPATLQDVKPGMRIDASQGRAANNRPWRVTIQANSPGRSGTLSEVDGKNLVVYIQKKRTDIVADDNVVVFFLSQVVGEQVVQGGRRALADLKPGMLVTVIPETGTAQKIVVSHWADEVFDSAGGFLKRSPFSAVRWDGTRYNVQVNGAWYELVSIDGQTTAQLIAIAKREEPGSRDDPKAWQKRVDEDLFEMLTLVVGHMPGDEVKLELRKPGTTASIVLENVSMTKENRDAVWLDRNKDLIRERDLATQPADRGPAATRQIPATQLP